MRIGFRKKFFKNKTLGQSTAEYLIILILVAISSIGVMSLFGQSIRQQISTVIAAFTGSTNEVTANQNNQTELVKEATNRSKNAVNMKIDAKDIQGFGSGGK